MHVDPASQSYASDAGTSREDRVVSAVATERQLLAKRLATRRSPGSVNTGHFATYYVMRVRLVRKLADILDGIDVSAYKSGDIVNLSPHDAELLIAEQWAVAAEYAPDTAQPSPPASDVLLAIDQLNRQTAAPHRRRDEGMETAKGPAPRSRD
jgi:muconolactone delta-isomerase